MDIKGHVALVTGAGTGFGRAIALELARAGCQLVLVGRRQEKLEETAQHIGETVPKKLMAKDVSSSMDVDEIAQETLSEFGQLHILVNNAGIFPENSKLQETQILDWDETFATNLRGPYLLLRAFLPSMVDANYGRVVNISAPLKHYPGAAGYCASKCALDSLTKATAFENKTNNILVNAVEPPFMDTEMHTGGAAPEEIAPKLMHLFDPEETRTRGRILKLE
ncbi:MAG: SDR family oxidoreductase [Verrucomicrobiota bacterium]